MSVREPEVEAVVGELTKKHDGLLVETTTVEKLLERAADPTFTALLEKWGLSGRIHRLYNITDKSQWPVFVAEFNGRDDSSWCVFQVKVLGNRVFLRGKKEGGDEATALSLARLVLFPNGDA